MSNRASSTMEATMEARSNVTFKYEIDLTHEEGVTFNFPQSEEGTIIFDIFLTCVSQTKIRTSEGEIITLTDQKTSSRPIQAHIVVSSYILSMPSYLESYIRNNLLWYDIFDDESICDALALDIVCYMFSANIIFICNRTIGSSFRVVGRLVVSREEVIDETVVLGGLKKEVFDGGHHIINDQLMNCAICLEDFLDGCECTRTWCSHVFHYRCMIPWLVKSDSCPICRRVLRDKLEEL
ncbi:hypothetical protein LguiB_009852 [Lonicera macranthoides]